MAMFSLVRRTATRCLRCCTVLPFSLSVALASFLPSFARVLCLALCYPLTALVARGGESDPLALAAVSALAHFGLVCMFLPSRPLLCHLGHQGNLEMVHYSEVQYRIHALVPMCCSLVEIVTNMVVL